MKNNIGRKSIFRFVLGIGIPILVIIGVAYLFRFGNPFTCPVYKYTGLYCTGCGSGRASYDLLHCRIIDALDHNLLMVLWLPFIIYYLFKRYIKIIFNKDILPFVKFSPKAINTIIHILILFTILRNIPFYPFTILAP